ncbi:MAG: hypothetical protein K2L93_06545, partial [Muribaculaceae bacterium]|nr:hypothetical protein [Muribaculaceae bacterium]
VTKAIQDALNSPLLKFRNILGSKKLLFNLYFSRDAEKKFAMEEVSELTTFVTEIQDVDVIWGVAFDESLGDKVKITILAAGFDDRTTQMPRKEPQHTSFFDRKKAPAPPTDEEKIDRMSQEYGAGKIEKMRQEKEVNRYIILTPEQFDDDTVLETLENVPTFNRDRRIVEQVRSQANDSRSQASATQRQATADYPANNPAQDASQPENDNTPPANVIDFTL